jgi:PEP-CTERM motif
MLRLKTLACAACATFAAAATPAAAAGILDLAGLISVQAYEATNTLSDGSGAWAANDARLTQRLAVLTAANRDFGIFPGTENYDIFVSDEAGNLDAGGRYLTIEGNCTVPYVCFNVTGVSLKFGALEHFATVLTRAVYGRPNSFEPDTAGRAVDGDLNTYTRLGDTIGLGEDARMAITVGFEGLNFGDGGGAVPEPSTWAMLILGFATAGGALRRARRPATAA